MRMLLILLIALSSSWGCARMVVRKNPGPRDTGVRYYRPKPYLFIGPGASAEAKSEKEKETDAPIAAVKEMQAELFRLTSAMQKNDDSEPATLAQLNELQVKLDALASRISTVEGNLEKQPPTLQPVTIRLEYLPDYSEEYSIKVTPGLGTAKLTAQLQNGWNLTSINTETDQQYDEIITSVAQLVGAFGKGAGRSDGPGATDCHAESNVPMGYYEAVIATDECGRKQMMGWRYVGFMPCYTCPVTAHVHRNEAICDDDNIYGLTFVDNVLQMKKMRDMKSVLKCPDCYCPESVMTPHADTKVQEQELPAHR